MPKATDKNGVLAVLPTCYIDVPIPEDINLPGMGGIRDGISLARESVIPRGPYRIEINNLPDISDSKGAQYPDQTIPGRSTPITTFSHGENRMITITLHLYVRAQSDIAKNLTILRVLQSALYTRSAAGGAPFVPPVVCRLRCGRLLADNEVCAALTQCSVRHNTDVVWDESTLLPHSMDIETTWKVVYKNTNLPGQDKILKMGV